MIEKNIYKIISKYDSIVLARHIGPDPDAIASQIALRDSIRLTFPKKKVSAVGVGVSRFKYIGLLDKLDGVKEEESLLIVLDVPNIWRVDVPNFDKYKEVIKIDHHPYEDQMGKCEWVDTNYSSTCEMITDLIFNTRLKMNEEIARNLYVGIVTDSDRFLLTTTSSHTLLVCSKLISDYNINLTEIYNHIYQRPLNEFKFQAYLALNMSVTENGFAFIKITPEIMKEYNVDASTASNMINNFNYIKEYYSWAFSSYDEKNDIYKISIRSRGPIINLVANKYNGGGHKYASGARIKTDTDVDKLFQELDEVCLEYKNELDKEV